METQVLEVNAGFDKNGFANIIATQAQGGWIFTGAIDLPGGTHIGMAFYRTSLPLNNG